MSESPISHKNKRKFDKNYSSTSSIKRHKHDEKAINNSPHYSKHNTHSRHKISPKQERDDNSADSNSNKFSFHHQRISSREISRSDRSNNSNLNADVNKQYLETKNRKTNEERRRYDKERINHKLQIKQEVDSEGKWGVKEDEKTNMNKEKPNLKLSGKLTEDTNTFKGVVIKYNEPPEARKPKKRWRFYPFKGTESLPILHLHRQSAYLLGRDRRIADIPVDHPSCSKQHAVLQFRMIPFEKDDGTVGRRVRPYIIDLDSANGTYVNNNRIESSRYVELKEKDVVKFGYSKRDYVLLHDSSDKTQFDDDDVN